MDISNIKFDQTGKSVYEFERHILIPKGPHRCICTEIRPIVPKTSHIPWILDFTFIPLRHTFECLHYSLSPNIRSIERYKHYVGVIDGTSMDDFLLLTGDALLTHIRHTMQDLIWIVEIIYKEIQTHKDDGSILFPYARSFCPKLL